MNNVPHSDVQANGSSHGQHNDDAARDAVAARDEDSTALSEWDRLWDVVQKNPDDFASWEYLLRSAEQDEGGSPLNKDSSDASTEKLRTVYDHFLAKFPLCFGYWKKYADWELLLEGAQKSVEIFERGVVSIHNSIDLWTQYAAFRIETFPDDESAIRSLFDRGADQVGQDFLSHPFWDKYIDFEESKQNTAGVVSILERIVHIPLHQYARYFEKYTTLTAEGDSGEAGKADEEDQRKQAHDRNVATYMKTQSAVEKRWVFEAEIKRPYFHVKPLDEGQLVNWRKYLDFEETEGEQARIYTLYERCLVPCALYEEFWQRYVRFVLSRDDRTGAHSIFIRATTIFVPSTRPAIRLSYAAFEEGEGRVDKARAVYASILQQRHLETLTKSAYFEQRQAGLPGALKLLTEAIAGSSSNDSKAYLEVVKARIQYKANHDIMHTRSVYEEAIRTYSASKFLFLSYLLFEIQQNVTDEKAVIYIGQAWTSIKASTLAAEEKRDLGLRYLDHLHETSNDIALINAVELEVLREYSDKAGEASRKRSVEGTDAGGRVIKQMRASSSAPVPPAPVAPVAPTGYYPPQQPTGYYPQTGYAPQGYGAAANYYGAAAGGWDYSQQQQHGGTGY
ncbi:hypothetical protein HKX48_005933 [Thoreauomyces humboldtii]|nr:hypothetical protein HKX48_005933 [Thoreauomyces humboldtii]